MEEWIKTHSPYIVCIAVLLLWGARITPEVRATADKVVKLNDLESVNLKIGWGGCGIPVKGNL